MEKINILFAEDGGILRDAIVRGLESENPENGISFAVTTTSTWKDTIQALGKDNYALALLSFSTGCYNSLHLATEIRKVLPELKIVLLSGVVTPGSVQKVLEMQLQGQISLSSSMEELRNALLKVYGGEQVFDMGAIVKLVRDDYSLEISKQELTFLRLFVEGLTMRELVRYMQLSERTILRYKEKLRKKFRVKTDAGMAAYALKNHLV